MKNINKILVFLFLMLLSITLVGCNSDKKAQLEIEADKVYLAEVSETSINYDFKLPKYVLGNKEYVVTWVSNNSDVIDVREFEADHADNGLYYLAYVSLASTKETVKLTATIKFEKFSTEREFLITIDADDYTAVDSIAAAKEKGDKVANTSLIKIEGTIAHTTLSGYFVTDGTDTIYVYNSNHGRTVGEKVIVRATWATYNNMPQLASPSVKVIGTDKDFDLANVAETMKVSEIDDLEVHTLDPENCTKIIKTTFQIEALPSGSYNAYKFVDTNGKYVEVSKYNDAATITTIGGMVDPAKFYEGYVITYCSRGSGIWDVILVVDGVKETTVTVTDQEKVDKIKLSLQETFAGFIVKEDLELPVENETYGATISWASDTVAIIANDGKFTAPEETTKVKLTATITLNDVTNTIEIEVTAKAASNRVNLIEDVRESHAGADIVGVTIEGVVTNVIGNTYFVQDSNYAIMIYNQAGHGFVKGDSVSVTGTLNLYNGLYQIKAVTASEKIDKKFAANCFEITTFDKTALAGKDSTLVSLYDLTYVSGTMVVATDAKYTSGYNAASIIFKTADDVSVTLRTDAYMGATQATALAGVINALTAGDVVSLVGVNLGWYNGPQITPSNATQICGENVIKKVRASHAGTNIVGVTVEGVVTNVIGNTYYLQDGDYAIMIYNHASHGFVKGDTVSVTGTLTVYNGLFEITTITASEKITKSFVANEYVIENYDKDVLTGKDNALVSMYNLTYVSGTMKTTTDTKYTSGYSAASIIFKTADDVSVTVRTDAYMGAEQATALAAVINALTAGDVVNLVGVNMGWYNGPQITPSLASQIAVVPAE